MVLNTNTTPSNRSLNVLKFYQFFQFGALSIVFVYFPLYFSEMGLNKLEVGMIMAGGPLISILANPIWGFVSDRSQNIRKTIIILLLGNFVVAQLVFNLNTFTLLFACMLMFFFFFSPLTAQSNSLVLNSIDGTRYKFGAFRLWGSLGYALIALGAGAVIHSGGTGRLWFIYSLLLIMSLLFTIGMPRGKVVTSSSAPAAEKGYGSLYTNKLFMLFIVLGIVVSVPNSINNTFVSIYIQELGGTGISVGLSAFLSSFFEIPVFLLLDRFIKQKTRFMLTCLAVVSLLFSLRWVLMSSAMEPSHIMLIQVMHCITFGAYYYLGTTLTSLMVDSRYRASGQALFALTWAGVSGVVAGFAGGWLYETLGAKTMYSISAIVALCGSAGFLLLLRMAKGMKEQRTDGA